MNKSPSALVEIRIYVGGQVTVNKLAPGLCPVCNVKCHLADGTIANGTKPGIM